MPIPKSRSSCPCLVQTGGCDKELRIRRTTATPNRGARFNYRYDKIIANQFVFQKYLQVKKLVSRFQAFLGMHMFPLGAYFPDRENTGLCNPVSLKHGLGHDHLYLILVLTRAHGYLFQASAFWIHF